MYAALEYLQQGGWIMWPLGLCSLVMWALIIDRLIDLYKIEHNDISIVDALSVVRGEQKPSNLVGVRASLSRKISNAATGNPELDRDLVSHCSSKIRPHLRRSLAVIAILAGIAPLLGLLGTVIGMIETFDVISLFGTGNARAMAGGISVAMVTTQSGLLVAIPGMLFSGYLFRRARRLENFVDETASVLQRTVRGGQV